MLSARGGHQQCILEHTAERIKRRRDGAEMLVRVPSVLRRRLQGDGLARLGDRDKRHAASDTNWASGANTMLCPVECAAMLCFIPAMNIPK
jgi:hypothetical protein